MRHPIFAATRRDRSSGDRGESEIADDRLANDHARPYRRRRRDETEDPGNRRAAHSGGGGRRSHVRADADGGPAHGRSRPARPQGTFSRLAIKLPAGDCPLRQDPRTDRGRRPYRYARCTPGQGFRHAHAVLGAPAQAESLERDFEMTYVPLDQLLKESDFVSVHSPLTPETIHQIGSRELALMKPNAYLINTARGAIVDAAALARALKKRQIAGAGLDVFEHEPKVTPSLLKLPNVVTTPHLGSAVGEVREQMANIVVDNILAFLQGKIPPNCFNPEVLRG